VSYYILFFKITRWNWWYHWSGRKAKYTCSHTCLNSHL